MSWGIIIYNDSGETILDSSSELLDIPLYRIIPVTVEFSGQYFTRSYVVDLPNISYINNLETTFNTNAYNNSGQYVVDSDAYLCNSSVEANILSDTEIQITITASPEYIYYSSMIFYIKVFIL